MKKLSILLAALLGCVAACAQYKPDATFNLWPDGAPTSNGLVGKEIDLDTHVSNVTQPVLYVFLPEKPNGKAILACPGGGYVDVWVKTEGFFHSKWYTDQGFVYAVLKYRLPNGHPEVPLDDVHEAMRVLKSHAADYGFDKLGVLGCSAGGHLAATAATNYGSPDLRPDFQILFYPVITMDASYTHGGSRHYLLGDNPSEELVAHYSLETRVTADTPPAFIMANSDDGAVPVQNGVNYYLALQKAGVLSSLHVYPTGGHGWCDHLDFVYREQWMNELSKWLTELK